ncbi:MAG: hypothetical protein WAV21_00040 [Minisyncoccia bacterium]
MLTSLATVLVMLHAFGSALGAGGVTFAEIFYTKATADGVVDTREREWFSTTFWALRWGMTMVLFSGLALAVLQVAMMQSSEILAYESLWKQNTLALIIAVSAWLLVIKRLSFKTTSAIIFTAWWMMFFLDVWKGISFSYFSFIFSYVIAVFFSLFVWEYARALAHRKALKRIIHRKEHEFKAHSGHS